MRYGEKRHPEALIIKAGSLLNYMCIDLSLMLPSTHLLFLQQPDVCCDALLTLANENLECSELGIVSAPVFWYPEGRSG